jgi:hypothetical protein
MLSCWKQSEPINATVLPDPVPGLHMIRMGVLRETGGLGLLGREKALLVLRDLIEPPKCFWKVTRRLSLNLGVRWDNPTSTA